MTSPNHNVPEAEPCPAKGPLSEPHQEVTPTGGKTCLKAPGFRRDKGGPSKHGEMLSAVPLPALSMTRARAAHDHFRMQVQKRAVGDVGREATASTPRNGLD